MLLAAEVTKKRKKSKNSPGTDEADAKRPVVKMAAKNPTGQKPAKDKGQSQDSQASSPYIMPSSFPYQQQYSSQFNTPNSQFVQSPGIPNSPFVQNPGSPILMNQSQHPQPQPFNTDIYSKLDFIMSKVSLIDNIQAKISKLDNIESQQDRILTRLNKIESSVAGNKKKHRYCDEKVIRHRRKSNIPRQ